MDSNNKSFIRLTDDIRRSITGIIPKFIKHAGTNLDKENQSLLRMLSIDNINQSCRRHVRNIRTNDKPTGIE